VTRRTKIVATLGPAVDRPDVLEGMVRNGVDVVRLNLSHGPLEDHLARLARVRDVAARLGRPVAVLADLPGPKIRAGEFPEGGVEMPPGRSVALVPGDGPSSAEVITVDYPTLLEDVDPGDRVMLGDGGISMRITERTNVALRAEIESGGRTQGRPGVHLSC
jgi:pyruvate kinase